MTTERDTALNAAYTAYLVALTAAVHAYATAKAAKDAYNAELSTDDCRRNRPSARRLCSDGASDG